MQRNIITLLIACTLWSCSEPDLERTYVIKRGEHYASQRGLETLQSNTLEFYAAFNETAVYDLGDDALQTNKNKLLGFSDCNSAHHENSARFAWQWYRNRLEIYAYCYVNGVRVEQYIDTVAIGTKNKYSIHRSKTHYEFSVNSKEVIRIERGNTCERGLYYLLWPYFGGSIPAPHDVSIIIQRIY
jgi:hypothetical protein